MRARQPSAMRNHAKLGRKEETTKRRHLFVAREYAVHNGHYDEPAKEGEEFTEVSHRRPIPQATRLYAFPRTGPSRRSNHWTGIVLAWRTRIQATNKAASTHQRMSVIGLGRSNDVVRRWFACTAHEHMPLYDLVRLVPRQLESNRHGIT